MAQDFVSAALKTPDGIVLLYHRKKYLLNLPTGKVEEGESPVYALRREMQGKLGIEVVEATLQLTTQHVSPEGNPYMGFHFDVGFVGEIRNMKHEIVYSMNFDLDKLWQQLAD